uniref:Uncharacterized protein n=1 Tax=Zea mays TaxID=4577 RepID=A0A804QW90_MAIZE
MLVALYYNYKRSVVWERGGRAGRRPRGEAEGVRVRDAAQVQQDAGGQGQPVPSAHVRGGDLHAPVPAVERGADAGPGGGRLVLHARVHDVRPDAAGVPAAVPGAADDAERHPVRGGDVAVLEPDGRRRPLLPDPARLRRVLPLPGGARRGAGHPAAAPARDAGADVRAAEPRVPAGRVHHRPALRQPAQVAGAPRGTRHAALHLRLLPRPLLRHGQRPRRRLLREGRSRVGVGELQGQPAVRHLDGAPGDVLRGHAARHLLPVPAGVGAVEPAAGGGGGVRVHPRDHRGRHRAAVRGRHPLGGHERVRGGAGRAAPRLHPHLHPAARHPAEAAPAGEGLRQAGAAVPPARQARGRLPPGAQRAGAQAAAPRGRVPAARGEGARLGRRTRERPQAVVVGQYLAVHFFMFLLSFIL